MNAVTRVELLGFPIDVGAGPHQVLDRLQRGNASISYLNPRAWYVQRRYPDYPELLGAFDLVCCDGIAVQYAVRTCLSRETPIVSMDFSGIAHSYLEHVTGTSKSLCLVGGTPAVNSAALLRIQSAFPEIMISGTFDGYGKSIDDAIRHIVDEQPDMVLVAMGMYLQERFVLRLRDAGSTTSAVCVGGFFDKLADEKKEFTEWERRHNLRFLGNIRSEPWRFLWRYGIEYQWFLWRLVRFRLTRGRDRRASG